MAITITTLGGVESANQQLTNLAGQVPSALKAQGMNGWTAFPSFLSENWFSVVATIILPVGIGVLAQPQLAVRFMTAKNAKTLNRAIPVGGVFLVLMTGFAFTIGAWSNVYFWNNLDFHTISFLATTPPKDVNAIIPLYINTSMDQNIVVMFMLTLLAAAMSTLSSLFHVMGSAAGYDLWATVKKFSFLPQKWRGEESGKTSLRINRYATILMIAISLAIALIIQRSDGVIASAFLPLFVHTLFAKKPSKSAARISLAVGTFVWFFWTLFVFAKDSVVFGLSNALFHADSILAKPWSIIDPIVIALPLSTIALIVVYYWDKRSRMDAAEGAPTT
jgi:SSS family solute:Na+ symporter